MKLIIQIPCYNEADTLPQVLQDLPREIPGVSSIETLVIDDGSSDGTSEVAKGLGVTHVVRNVRNLGLAFTFRRGIDAALAHGADIIVNLDGDNQYKGSQIPALIRPILEGRADMVVGDRQTDTIPEFSALKKFLQRLGSAVIRRLSHTNVSDTTSGFRAFSREAALKLTILSNYTYTHEAILQAPSKGLTIVNVRIDTNPKTRPSRLMRGVIDYLVFSVASIVRIFAMYNPLRVFLALGSVCVLFGSLLTLRFLYFYFTAGGVGKIQSLIIAAIAVITGSMIILVGIIADIIQFNRRLLEDILERIKRIENKTPRP
jgi:glycosyltransferase involved in cell wall biosynthesis